MSKHIITDFKDLRDAIEAVSKSQPAQTQYERQAEKMGYMQEAESKPEDDTDKKDAFAKRDDHAGEEDIIKGYKALGDKALTGSVEYRRKLLQKELAKMGFKTYSKYAFDSIFKFEGNMQEVQLGKNMLMRDFPNVWATKDSKLYRILKVQIDVYGFTTLLKSYKKDRKKFVDSLKKIAKSPAAQKRAWMGAKDMQYINKPKKGQSFWSQFDDDVDLDEGKMGALLLDIQQGATAKELAKDYKIPLAVAKNFLKDYYGTKKGSRKEDVQEGTWAVPDEFYKLKKVQDLINKKIPGTKANAKKFADDMYSLFGDDGFFDDLARIEMNPDPKVDLRDILVKHLSDWTVRFKGYKITHGPSSWMQGRIEEKIKKGKGNIKRPTGKIIKFEKLDPVGKADDDIDNDGDTDDSDKYLKNRRKKISKSMKMKEANKSPFKLKSQAYPRAVGIDTEGYGTRHATRDDLVEACDSFGMITEQELQIEQLQKTLGKSGFLTYNITELNDIFDERETQRMILALESVTSDETLEPIDYSRAQIDEALETESEIEFVKPDGMKAVGPILKMCENTYNVKDKHTGKSFTFKYIGEEEVKTFKDITEAKFPKKLVRMAMGIVWDKRYAGGNMTGAVKAIEKLKKGLSDDPAVSNALRLANESFQSPFFNALSEDDKAAYQAFFNKAMKKFGISSPSELSGEKEKEFYDYIDKNWKADHEEEVDVHKSYKIDGRRTNFREKMRKLVYIKV